MLHVAPDVQCDGRAERVAHEPAGATCSRRRRSQEPANLFTGVAEAVAAVLLVGKYPEVQVHVAENRVLLLLLVLVLAAKLQQIRGWCASSVVVKI